jgi:hypothetical protein
MKHDRKRPQLVGNPRTPFIYLPAALYHAHDIAGTCRLLLYLLMVHPLTSICSVGEAWEEAGITGRITRSLGEIGDPRPQSALPKGQPRTLYYFFEFAVDREEDRWPEMHKRRRRWLTYEEAAACFRSMDRPELVEALDRSSVIR